MSKTELYFIGNVMLFTFLVFNVLETWYFGWNIQPSCKEEIICDYISKFGVMAGLSIATYAAFIKFWEV